MPDNSLDVRDILLEMMATVLELGSSPDDIANVRGLIVLIDPKDLDDGERYFGRWREEKNCYVLEEILGGGIEDIREDEDGAYYPDSLMDVVLELETPQEMAGALLTMAEANHLEPHARWGFYLEDY